MVGPSYIIILAAIGIPDVPRLDERNTMDPAPSMESTTVRPKYQTTAVVAITATASTVARNHLDYGP